MHSRITYILKFIFSIMTFSGVLIIINNFNLYYGTSIAILRKQNSYNTTNKIAGSIYNIHNNWDNNGDIYNNNHNNSDYTLYTGNRQKDRRYDKFNNLFVYSVHIPKAGGTSWCAILKSIACQKNPIANDVCCDKKSAAKECSLIKGCGNHIPDMVTMYYSHVDIVTTLRLPVSRLISGYFYKGHSPNMDYFGVRPEFKKNHKKDVTSKHYTFDEYIEMPEYQNIMTRMLGANSFPYRNVTITEEIYEQAKYALNKMTVVGIQEEFDVSKKLLIYSLLKSTLRFQDEDQDTQKNITQTIFNDNQEIKRKKEDSQEKIDILSNETLMKKANDLNVFDLRLYQYAIKLFCSQLSPFPDLKLMLNNPDLCIK